MVMKPEPLFSCVESLADGAGVDIGKRRIVLLSPAAPRFCQADAERLGQYEQLILVCGHYEGIDERVRDHLCDEALSVGDYVLTGGELPAMIVADAVVRLIPGALGAPDSAELDSYSSGLLEYPQYTRPRLFRDWEVPEVLLSGNHAEIAKWRRQEALRRTWLIRPDLLESFPLTMADRQYLALLKKDAKPEL
jgi:tRNA (guanine37-N1)-methyltransferase